jgi:hypothetical protein
MLAHNLENMVFWPYGFTGIPKIESSDIIQ